MLVGQPRRLNSERFTIEVANHIMITVENSDKDSKDLWVSIANLRVLCIGNGGIIWREGGIWTHRWQGEFLAEMGKMVGEICYCAWLDPTVDPLSQTALTNMEGVRAVALPRFHGAFVRKLKNGVLSLAILTREVWRAQFVYLYWPGRIASITARLCRIIGKPYGIYFRGEQIDSDCTFATSFRHARFVLTTGNVLRTTAKAHCGDVENVTPMTPVQPEQVIPPRSPRQSGPWHLLYVGRIEERKGVPDLLEAVSRLEEWGLPFVLTMVGHCHDASGLLQQLPPSVARCVRLIDGVADFQNLIPFYCAADVFVLPSRYGEGFPRVLYEAMAFGLPILTTFNASIPSVMQDGMNCLRIEAGNPKDIADKIRHLVTSPELQTQIARSAHQCITELMKTWQRSHPVQIAERLRDFAARTS